MKLKIKNLSRIKRRLRAMHPAIQKRVGDAAMVAGTMLENAIKREIRLSPASGETYGKHTASSAGNPPRANKGDHINAIKTRQSRFSQTKVTVGVHKDERDRKGKHLGKRAYFLEVGTSHMDARPVLKPTANKNRKKIVKTLEKAAKQGIKDVRRVK